MRGGIIGRYGAALGIVALAAVGLAINRGPIGFGNGPVAASSPFVSGWVVPVATPTADVTIGIMNHAGPATLTGVALGGVRGFQQPSIRDLAVRRGNRCVLSVGSACGMGTRLEFSGSLIPGDSNLPNAPLALDRVLVVTLAVAPTQCVVISSVVLHYEAQGKRYSSTVPEDFSLCGERTSSEWRHAAESAVRI